ncbi:MAG: hypothetical protein WDN00_19075 [Limisphaerales bacterium]
MNHTGGRAGLRIKQGVLFNAALHLAHAGELSEIVNATAHPLFPVRRSRR